jgi:hypothetical protein
MTKGGLIATVAVIGLAVSAALPFRVCGGPYGQTPIPGSATVHLPAGQVDAALRAAGPGDAPVPPLSIRIVAPDGTAPPEVIDSPRAKHSSAEYDGELVRVWVVHVAQEGDYHVELQGDVYGPYQRSLIFVRHMWNEPLEVLLVFCAATSWTAIGLTAAMGVIGLALRLWVVCTNRRESGMPRS